MLMTGNYVEDKCIYTKHRNVVSKIILISLYPSVIEYIVLEFNLSYKIKPYIVDITIYNTISIGNFWSNVWIDILRERLILSINLVLSTISNIIYINGQTKNT